MTDFSTIENYIHQLEKEEKDFLHNTNPEKSIQRINNLKKIFFVLQCFLDFCLLHFVLSFQKYKSKKIIYTAYNFCNAVNGELEDRIVKPLFYDNILFINQSKEIYLKKINNQKVYNLGGIAKILKYFYVQNSEKMKYFKAYQCINDSIFQRYSYKDIYLLWFYDLNSLSIIFSKHRQKLHLIEVQHGSIINYPPYKKPAPVKIIDTFYVKNQLTIDYLKNHLCKNFECNYNLIPYPENTKVFKEGIHILYASTVDFNGLHPVFIRFLESKKKENLNLQLRLHPRERTPDKKLMFEKKMLELNVKFTFDENENWLESNIIKNLIVISPWSSTIEDAFDNNYKTIIIDPIGKERFKHIIDNVNCFYSDDIEKTIKLIPNFK